MRAATRRSTSSSRVGRLPRLEQGSCVLRRLQQPVDAAARRTPRSRPPLASNCASVPNLLRIPDLPHVLLHRREQPTRPQHLVRPVQILLPRDPLPALDLVDHVLAVPHGRPELGGPHPHRLPPQLQLPPHGRDDRHTPVVVRVDLPTRLVRLALEPPRVRRPPPSSAPLRRTTVPQRPTRTRRSRQPGQRRTSSGQSPYAPAVVTVHGKRGPPR